MFEANPNTQEGALSTQQGSKAHGLGQLTRSGWKTITFQRLEYQTAAFSVLAATREPGDDGSTMSVRSVYLGDVTMGCHLGDLLGPSDSGPWTFRVGRDVTEQGFATSAPIAIMVDIVCDGRVKAPAGFIAAREAAKAASEGDETPSG